MPTLPYVGRAPDSDSVLVPKSYADSANAAQALTTTQVNNQIAATTPSLTTQSYVDTQDGLLAHRSAVDAADATYISTALLNAAHGVAGLDSSGNVLSALLPPASTVTTDRMILGYSLATVVGFDAVGTPGLVFNSTNTSLTVNGSHTAAGGTTNVVLAFLDAQTNASTDIGAATLTATYGGTAMTPVPGSRLNFYHPSTGIYSNCALFYLFNPPTGAQTVAYTVTSPGSANYFITGQSVSYTNVGSLGTLVTNSGTLTSTTTGLSLSVARPTNGMVSMAFGTSVGGGTATLASFNKTMRYNNTTASTGLYMLVGDANDASTESFTASLAIPAGNSAGWVGLGVPLSPPSSPTAIGTTFITAPTTITSTSSPVKIASIVVPDPGWPWRPIPFALVQGDSSGSTAPANRSTGTGSYGVLTVAAPSGGQIYGLATCTGSYYTDTYLVRPYATAGQTPTSVPAVTGSLELDLNAGLWSGTTYTYYPTNLVFQVLVVPAV